MDGGEPTAFVDESLRPGPAGLYVIAAAVVIDDVPKARACAQQVPPAGKRFHWNREREPYREAMLDALLGLGCGL